MDNEHELLNKNTNNLGGTIIDLELMPHLSIEEEKDGLLSIYDAKEKTRGLGRRIDGKILLKAKRGTVMIDKYPHTVIARPEGYIEKEAYIQPPYQGKKATLSFTFMIQDKIDYQTTDEHNIIANEGSNDKFKNNDKINEIEILSDVDENIPSSNQQNSNIFALIIGNEDYSSFQPTLKSEVNVAFAINDAKVFKEYTKSVLGVPEENIIYLANAKTVEMNRSIEKLSLYAKNMNGKAALIFYYAGHGLPHEVTKEPYLIPVDVSSSDLKFAVNLKDLYAKLSEFPTQKVTVFIDACFSGGARNQGLVEVRGVKVKPKDELLKGNLVVFTASSGEQSSSAYKDKHHGMFTYFLLKKLQETKGNLTYKQLADYLSSEVGLKSVMINDKEQNPQVNVSPDVQGHWEKWVVTEF